MMLPYTTLSNKEKDQGNIATFLLALITIYLTGCTSFKAEKQSQLLSAVVLPPNVIANGSPENSSTNGSYKAAFIIDDVYVDFINDHMKCSNPREVAHIVFGPYDFP